MIENQGSDNVKVSSRLLYCPNCASSLKEPGSFINEYWASDNTVYFCWCSNCGFRCEVTEVSRVVATEPGE